jgi:hypothetical protein
MIHTRGQLINWIINATSDDVLLQAAFRNMGTRVELYGTFDPLPGSSKSGWLVRVTTLTGREDLIAVVRDHLGRALRWYNTMEIPWDTWQGPHEDELISGDNQDQYATRVESKDDAIHRIQKCTALHTQPNRGKSLGERREEVDGQRNNHAAIPKPLRRPVKKNVHNKKPSRQISTEDERCHKI